MGTVTVFNESMLKKISCVCITRNRPVYLKRAIECFKNQTYGNKEMVILYYGNDQETKEMALANEDPEIHYHEYDPSEGLTLGYVRNRSLEYVTGEYVCVWDDDDWHHPNRLIKQYCHIISSQQPACTLRQLLVFDLEENKLVATCPRNEGWEGSLMCETEVMIKYQYGNLNISEDTHLCYQLSIRGLINTIDDPELYVYFFHIQNTSSRKHLDQIKGQSEKLDKEDEKRIRGYIQGHIDDYKASIDIGKISALCITRDRLEELKQSIECFKKQTYKKKEMVVVYYSDDIATKAFAEGNRSRLVKFYEHDVSEDKSLGHLRNWSIELATGDYVCIWDDDDWFHPKRMEKQALGIVKSKKPACAIRQITLYETSDGSLMKTPYRFEGWENTILCKKEDMIPYVDLNVKEDKVLLPELAAQGKLYTIDRHELYIYFFHNTNVSTARHFRKMQIDCVEFNEKEEKVMRKFVDKIKKPTLA